jgi:hypothetical protein
MKINEILTEQWSQKYKSSINCSHPKGFSQKAHCAGKKKTNESVEMEMVCEDCGMCKTHSNINEIAKGAKDSNGFTKCWPGKHAEGTKKGKNGGPVRNCVPNEGVAEGSLEANTPNPVVVVQDLKGKILDKVNLSMAVQKYKLGNPQDIKNQLAHQNYTTIGNYVIVSPMSGQPQDNTTQGMTEGAMKDIHIELSNIVANEDFDALYQLFSSNTPAGRYVQDMYDDVVIDTGLHPDDDFEQIEQMVFDRLVDDFGDQDLNEFAAGSGGGSGNYFQELASAWYNGVFDTGNLQKGIKSQQDVERLLQRGVVAPDGVTRKYGIDYNSDFDGVVISSDDYYEHSDYNNKGQEVDSRTGQPWGPYDYMEFGDNELDEGADTNTELAEEFDLIESIIASLAKRNRVNAEVIWEDLESLTDDELYVFAVTTPIMEDWQKANKRDRTAGMSQKAVNSYRREHPGSKLKTAVTTKPSKLKRGSKASKRRKSYCSRSRGQMKMHSISCAKTPDKAICKARRRWNC